MATKYATAKDAINAQNATPTTPPTPATPTTPPVVAPVTPALNSPASIPSPAPRVEGQWNYGTANEQVLAPKVETPKVEAPVVKPATAKEAITTGFKQEIKPLNVAKDQPLTTEIGREAKLGQLPNVEIAKNQEEQARINTQNLKSSSGQQLWSNLDTLSKTNPSLLASRDAYDKAFGYQTKDAGEKALVDAFWNAKKNDANGIYNSLATGQKLPAGIEKSPAFSDALIRHQDTTRFENLNPYQLSKLIGTEFIPGTQTYNDLMAKNPQLVSDAVKLASWNMPVTARTETKTNWQDSLSNYLSRSPVMQNPTTVATIMNSDPNIATKSNEVQAVEDKLTEAKDRLKNIQQNVTERYKGTGATKQTVQAKALAESQDIIDEITMLEANKASASAALTTLIQNAKDNYSYARQDRQDALDQYNKGFAQLQSMAEMGMKQDDMEYQKQQDAVNRDLSLLQYYTNIDQANAKEARGYQFQEQSDLRNFDQQKELAKMGYNQQERMSNLNFRNEMEQLGATQAFTAGQNTVAQNNELIKSAMAQGMTYQDAVNQVMGTTSNVDRQSAISQYGSTPAVRNFNPGNITDTGFGGQKVAGERFTRFNSPQEGFNALVSKIENIQAGNSKVYSPTMSLLQYISKYAPASDNNNPVAYANGIAKNLGISPNTQLKDIDPNALALEHAKHEDGNMYKMLQDLGINKKQQIQAPTGTQTLNTGYNVNGKNIGESGVEVLAEIRDVLAKTPTEGRKMLKESGYTINDIAALNNNKLPKTGAQRQSAVSTMQQIKDLANMEWNDGVGRYDIGRLGPDGIDARAKIDTIVSLVTQPNLGMLKGPMSNIDLEFIKSGSSTLNPNQSNTAFEKNMVQLYNLAARTAGLKEVTNMNEIKEQNLKSIQTGVGTTNPQLYDDTKSMLNEVKAELLNANR